MKKLISIYGAHIIATTLYTALQSNNESFVTCFIVSKRDNNPTSIDGIPVIELDSYVSSKFKDNEIIIATPREHHREIIHNLSKYGLYMFTCLLTEEYNHTLEEFYTNHKGYYTYDNWVKDKNKDKMELESIERTTYISNLKLYIACSTWDKVSTNNINSKQISSSEYEEIQGGASVAQYSLGIKGDNIGEHISEKNSNYCELTVLYWSWKNESSDYVGLYHYRRHFNLELFEIYNLLRSGVEVILPYPTIHYPTIKEQHKRYINESIWKLFKECILTLYPEMKEEWDVLWNSQYFYNYNMMIVKRSILDCYCSWAFPILADVEYLAINRQIELPPRFAGYLGEILMTIFFTIHKNRYCILNTGVHFL